MALDIQTFVDAIFPHFDQVKSNNGFVPYSKNDVSECFLHGDYDTTDFEYKFIEVGEYDDPDTFNTIIKKDDVYYRIVFVYGSHGYIRIDDIVRVEPVEQTVIVYK